MVILSSSLLSIALLCSLEVNGQTTQTVQAGLQGSFFDPSYVVAQVGDIVSFVFSGNMHSVTQSTFENPCVALPGGFNSGLAGKGTNGTAPVPVWNLRITDASKPIWYFCQAVIPKSHCNAGMVGVINPPNITLFTQFQSSARAVTGTPTPSFGVTLSGVGAFATASPSDLSTMPPSASSGASSSGSSATATSVPPPSRSSFTSNIGAIVGGVVGGVLGLILILVAFLWVLRQRKSKKRSARLSLEDFTPTQKRRPPNLDLTAAKNTDLDISIPRRLDMTTPHSAVISPTRTRPERQSNFSIPLQTPRSTVFSQTGTLLDRQSNISSQTRRSTVFSQTGTLQERQSNIPSQTPRSTVFSQTGTLPERQSSIPPLTPRSTVFSQTGALPERQSSVPSQTPRSAVFSRARTLSEGQSSIDIQSLAQEVAVVLLQHPQFAGGVNVDGKPPGSRVKEGKQLQLRVENTADSEQDHTHRGLHSPPPHYCAIAEASEEGLPQEER